jgi:hypothetical protein
LRIREQETRLTFRELYDDDEIVEKIKTHVLSKNFFLENHGRYEVMCKTIVEPNRPQMTIRGMRIACWITKAKKTHTHTHLEHVIVIAFSLQH